MPNSYFVQVVVEPEDLAEVAAAVAALISAGKIVAGEVVASEACARMDARSAAEAAKSAASLDEALAAYVDKMPVGENVDRADVLQRARRYLQ